jgi:hypothetical protein
MRELIGALCGAGPACRLRNRSCRSPDDDDYRGGIREAWIMEALEHGAAAGRRRLLRRRLRCFGHSAHPQLLNLRRNRGEYAVSTRIPLRYHADCERDANCPTNRRH